MVLVGHIEITCLLVESAHLLHLFVAQLEVEDLDVLLDVGGIGGTGDYREALLDMPADNDLCSCLAVSLGNTVDDGVAQYFAFRITSTEGEPALDLDIIFLAPLCPIFEA